MTIAAECRRMAELIPGAPQIANLLIRAAADLEAPKAPTQEALRAAFDAGARAAAACVLKSESEAHERLSRVLLRTIEEFDTSNLKGRP